MGAGPELHGYTQWGSKTPELPSRVLNQHGIFPTIFQLLRDARPEAEIGCLYEWDGIKYLVDTLALSHYAQAPDYNKHPEALCGMAEKYIKEKQPTLLAICFDNPDHVGHQAGHNTPEYYAKLKRTRRLCEPHHPGRYRGRYAERNHLHRYCRPRRH